MNTVRECALTDSLNDGDAEEFRVKTAPVKRAGLTVRPPRSTAGSARRNFVRGAVASAIVAMGIVGVGVGVVGAAGEASAKPMERDAKRYCAQLTRDVVFTMNAMGDATKRYGYDNALTKQAESNFEQAVNRAADAGC